MFSLQPLRCAKCLQITYSRLKLYTLWSRTMLHVASNNKAPIAYKILRRHTRFFIDSRTFASGSGSGSTVRSFSYSGNTSISDVTETEKVQNNYKRLPTADTINVDKCSKPLHMPVMARDVVNILNPKDEQIILDMTFGAGGHTKALLECTPGVRMFCLDRDPFAHELAKKLADTHRQVTPLLGRFSEAHTLLAEHGIAAGCVDAVLFDLGASSMQFDMAERGFSLSMDAPLDMRMDSNRLSSEQPTAADVVNWMDESGLYRVIKKYGEEKHARLIARAIVDSRYAFGRIATTRQLADIVASALQGVERQDKLQRRAHVATKTFQALRIFVNNELNELYNGLEVALHLLRAGSGVCAAISFHSLEDRIVKRHFLGASGAAAVDVTDQHRSRTRSYPEPMLRQLLQRRWRPLVNGVIEASDEETCCNPRARSAKLRAAVKLARGDETSASNDALWQNILKKES